MLLANGVDIVNVADGPRAMARMSNIAFCSLLLRDYGNQPRSCTCGGRDETCSQKWRTCLGVPAIGIRNLVIHHRRPPSVGDYPEATAVYDLDAIGLFRWPPT